VIQSTDLRPREPDFIAMRTGNQRESHGRARSGERDFGVSSRRPIMQDSAPQAHPQLRQQTAFRHRRRRDQRVLQGCKRAGLPHLLLLLTWRGHAEWGVSLSRSHTQGTRRSGSGLKSTGLGAPPRRIQGLNLFRSRVRPLTRATAPEAAQSRVAECGVSLRPHMPRQSEGALARKKAVRRT